MAHKLFLLVCFFGTVVGQIIHSGECPKRHPLNDRADPRKLSGLWYENQRTASLAEWPFKCIALNVLPFYEHKSELKVSSTNRFNGNMEKIGIPLTSLDAEGKNGKMVANLSNVEFTNGVFSSNLEFPIQLLAFGNNSDWAIIWSCRNFSRIFTEHVWVITKEREEDDAVTNEIRDALTTLNLEHFVMRASMQTGCAESDGEFE